MPARDYICCAAMETRLLIAGEQVAGEGPGLDVENPYTQTTLTTVALPSPEQVDAAIAAARAAARGWADTPAVERCELLHEVAARLRARTGHAGRAHDARGRQAARRERRRGRLDGGRLRLLRRDGRNFAGRVIPSIESTQLALVLKEPLGVVAAIVPWNYPLLLLAWKLAPALAAGNTVVCKPSELTPLSTLALAPCLDHLPPGVVGLLAGAGDVGEALVGDERVDGVAFTGSVETGKRIAVALRRARRAHQPRDGRQGPVHRLRRRRRRDRRRGEGRGVGGLPQRRPGVHLGRALLRDVRRLRRLRARVRRLHRLARPRRPARAADRPRAHGLRAPAREGGRAGRRGGRRGRRDDDRRRRRRAAHRALLRADGRHRRAGADRPAARGDLRPGGADRAGRVARRGDRAGQLDALRARAPTSTRATSRPSCAACARSRRGPCGSTTR